MVWPDDKVMLMLVAHAAGDTFTVRGGDLHVTVQSEDRTMPAPPEALDDLERRGWVVVEPDGRTVLTEQGIYAARRWLEQRLGKGALRRIRRVTGVAEGGR